MAVKAAAILIPLVLSSCLSTYRQFPANKIGAVPPFKTYAKLYYHVDDQIPDKNLLALQNAIKLKSSFREVEAVEAPPAQGLFVDVSIRTVPESSAARTYRAISYATLTVLPAWSARGGRDLTYEVYVDGRKMKNFDYQLRQKSMTWIVLLPFAWTNLLAYNQAQAYEATALQFFNDADPLIRTATTPAP